MKKILSSLIAISMISTPVLAHEREHEEYEEHEHHGGASVGAILGALVLGGIIAGASEKRYPNYPNSYQNRYDHTPRLQSGYTDQYGYWHDCYDEQVTDIDYYGHYYQHWVRRCN